MDLNLGVYIFRVVCALFNGIMKSFLECFLRPSQDEVESQYKYGKGLLKFLSGKLTKEFGKGFTAANLKNMRQFYLTFPKGYALRSQLS